MLILVRRPLERIIIGDDIFIEVLGIKGNQVRIAVDAPEKITVHREEVYKRIQNGEKYNKKKTKKTEIKKRHTRRSSHD